MSKFVKITITASICCVLAGGLLFFTGILLGGSRHFGYSIKRGFVDYEKDDTMVEEKVELDSFEEIKINAYISDIYISEGNGFYMEYRDEKDAAEWNVENGRFTFEGKETSSFEVMEVNLGIFGKSSEDEGRYIKLTVPAGVELSNIKIVSDLGRVEIKDISVNERLGVTAYCGDIEIENVSAPVLEADDSLGDISISLTEIGNGDIEADSGNIRLNEVKAEKVLKLKDNLGSIDIEDCEAGCGEIGLDNGSLSAEDLTVDEWLKVQDKLGDIHIKMKGGLGAYSYECTTSLGDVVVDGENKGSKDYGGSGSVKLILSNDCGDVELE